jgi:eukaryotic-like serine/threonine-protein kinase
MPKTCPVCATTYPDTDAFCPKDGSTLRLDEGATSLVGSVIADRYLVSKLLGEGGMGQVYLAGHVRLPQQAAIKVLHASMVQDAGAIARFNREAANAARIEHERVARVFDFGETNTGLVYLAMEFVPGRTLRSLLEEQKRLAPARAANIVYQVGEGLDAAHRLNIVHRDLKPDNVLVVTDDAGVDRCKVVDFGIAKALNESDKQRTQLTQVGSIIGTPEYMSPEQVLGEEIDARSDVYALGLVAFHLFTGSLPFGGATPERLLTARLIEAPSPLAVAAPDVAWPDDLQAVFDRALSSDVASRTPSALQFADELVAAVEAWTGEPLLRGRTPLSTYAVTGVSGAATPITTARVATGTPVRGSATVPSAGAGATTPMPVAGARDVAGGAARGGSSRLIAAVAGLAVVAVAGFMLTRGGGTTSANVPAIAASDSTVVAAGDTRARAAEGNAASGDRGAAGTPATSAPARDGGVRPADAGAAQGGTAARDAGNGASSATVPTPNMVAPSGDGDASAGGAAGADVRRALDTLDRVTDVSGIGPLNQLLSRVPTASDSARVYIKLALLQATAGNEVAACVAFRGLKRQARTDGQLQMIQRLQANEFFAACI